MASPITSTTPEQRRLNDISDRDDTNLWRFLLWMCCCFCYCCCQWRWWSYEHGFKNVPKLQSTKLLLFRAQWEVGFEPNRDHFRNILGIMVAFKSITWSEPLVMWPNCVNLVWFLKHWQSFCHLSLIFCAPLLLHPVKCNRFICYEWNRCKKWLFANQHSWFAW